MQRLAKAFLIAFAAVLLLAAIGMLAINLYVQSAGTQARIERELSAALRLPVRIAGTSLTPWSGLKINSIVVSQPDAAVNGSFLEASSFNAFFEWMPLLFHRRLVLMEIDINDPKIFWHQNENGKWSLPNEKEKPSEANAQIAPEAAPQKPSQPAPLGAHGAPEEKNKKQPLEISVNHFRINRGTFIFYDQHERRIATFEDVKVESPKIASDSTEGSATIGKITVHNVVSLDDARLAFSFAAGDLLFSKITAQVAGSGTLSGSAHIHTQEKHSPFSVDVAFDHVDLNNLLVDAGAQPGQASGELSGWLDLYGGAGKTESLGGTGALALDGGQIRQYEFFQLLGQALRIDELVHLQLARAQADYRVENDAVQIDRLFLQSQNLQLESSGAARFDGKLQLDARLTINERISRQLPNFIEANFKPTDEQPERHFIDFNIDGTITDPRTDLMERVLGRKIEKEMTDLLQNIFKPRKEKKERKLKDLVPVAPGSSPARNPAAATAPPGASESAAPSAPPAPATAE